MKTFKAKFHYTSWFGASSELASVMEFGFISPQLVAYSINSTIIERRGNNLNLYKKLNYVKDKHVA